MLDEFNLRRFELNWGPESFARECCVVVVTDFFLFWRAERMGELMDGGVPNRGAMAQRLLVPKLPKWQMAAVL